MCAADRDSRQPVRRTSSVYEAVRNAWTVGGLFSGVGPNAEPQSLCDLRLVGLGPL